MALHAGKREYSKAVQKMQRLCKQATINPPPNIYKNAGYEEGPVRDAFKELLAKHDLALDSSARDVERARRALATQRDLDGIDTSNIVTSRRRAAAPRVGDESTFSPLSCNQ